MIIYTHLLYIESRIESLIYANVHILQHFGLTYAHTSDKAFVEVKHFSTSKEAA